MDSFDVVIFGGGIVGLATAYRLQQRHPQQRIAILEKEPDLAHHQTGHNSGVLHSGIYYKPRSQKAVNCRLGKLAMEEFCRQHDVPFDICGKVIVAVAEKELPALERIADRGKQNGVNCELINGDRLRELEPHAAGIRAIHVPEAGIVDYVAVCQRLGEIISSQGGEIRTETCVQGVDRSHVELVVRTNRGELKSKYIINCTGLQSDRVTKLTGVQPEAQIVPFRGEYYELKPEAYHLCRNLIYPVPDPSFPFLGVHFTRMIGGSVECGPNAVLSFAREGYGKLEVNLRDFSESLTYGGFLKLAVRYWRMGLGEIWRSVSKAAFVRALQRLIPEIRAEHLEAAPAGIRAQAVAPDGKMVDDFLILNDDNVVNVCNAPSPAATSSLNIGDAIVDQLQQRF